MAKRRGSNREGVRGKEKVPAAATEPASSGDERAERSGLRGLRDAGETAERGSFRRRYQREITFLVLFVALLGGGFTLVSVNWVNDHAIEPFTAAIARASGSVLNVLGQNVRLVGTVIQGPRFAVNIRNGCNGVEAMLIFLAAVIAFPAPWRSRLLGLAIGGAVLQVVNLVRVVALFLTGVYWPRLFEASHTVIWQSVVILCGVLLWILWASRFADPLPRPSEPAA